MDKIIALLRDAQIELAANNRAYALVSLESAKSNLDSAIKYAVSCGIPESDIHKILKKIRS